MKNLFLIFVISLSVASCKTTQLIGYQRTGEVTCVEYDRETITLLADATGSTMQDAVVFAERNAFENLLFKGIPGCNQQVPMVENERESTSRHSSFYDFFLNNAGYLPYVMNSETEASGGKSGVYRAKQRVQIDLSALRRYLEKEKIIRKLGL